MQIWDTDVLVEGLSDPDFSDPYLLRDMENTVILLNWGWIAIKAYRAGAQLRLSHT
jgi:hypothetical protein